MRASALRKIAVLSAVLVLIGSGAGFAQGDSDDFSVGTRLGTWALNSFTIPGLGSAILMEDWIGGGIMFGLEVGGFVMLLNGFTTETHIEGSGYYAYEVSEVKPNALLYVGAGALLGNFVFNIVRSCTYHKPSTRLGANNADSFNFAVLPKSGELQYVAAYSKSF